MAGEDNRREQAQPAADRALWRRACATDAAEDMAERFLDLAGFADDCLDADERERIAELIAANPALAEDIGAARVIEAVEPADERVIARAAALVGANVVAFPPQRWGHLPLLREAINWGGLVAAMVVAGWLGFTLGMDTSLSFASNGQGEESALQQMLDPSPIFMRDPSEGSQT